MTPLGKQIVRGMAMTALGAFMWAVVFSMATVLRGSGSWWDALWFPPIGVLYASWFVLPFGILLGVMLPRLVQRTGARCTIAYAALVGAITGALAAYLAARFIWPASLALEQYAVTMIPFCAIWVAVWAWRLRQAHESVA